MENKRGRLWKSVGSYLENNRGITLTRRAQGIGRRIYRARGSGSIQQGDVVPLSFSGAGGWSDESAAECIEACDCPEFQKLLRSHEAKAGKRKTADMLKSMVTGYGTKAIKKQLLKGEAT